MEDKGWGEQKKTLNGCNQRRDNPLPLRGHAITATPTTTNEGLFSGSPAELPIDAAGVPMRYTTAIVWNKCVGGIAYVKRASLDKIITKINSKVVKIPLFTVFTAYANFTAHTLPF